MRNFTCPVCHNEEHQDHARFCVICGNALPLAEKPADEALETVKLLTLAAICYQRMFDEILRRAKCDPVMADLLMSVQTVQGTPNGMKIYELEQSGLDVNSIKSIDDVMAAMCSQREDRA